VLAPGDLRSLWAELITFPIQRRSPRWVRCHERRRGKAAKTRLIVVLLDWSRGLLRCVQVKALAATALMKAAEPRDVQPALAAVGILSDKGLGASPSPPSHAHACLARTTRADLRPCTVPLHALTAPRAPEPVCTAFLATPPGTLACRPDADVAIWLAGRSLSLFGFSCIHACPVHRSPRVQWQPRHRPKRASSSRAISAPRAAVQAPSPRRLRLRRTRPRLPSCCLHPWLPPPPPLPGTPSMALSGRLCQRSAYRARTARNA